MNRLPGSVLKNNTNIILIVIFIFLLIGAVFGYQKIIVNSQVETAAEEVDLPFDPEGPYAILYPRRDGNALVLNLKRTASYDKISYELAYTSDVDKSTAGSEDGDAAGGKIDRGVMGEIDVKDKKGEYEQEILFGTCSKNVCKYDTGVENGTLTLHIRKGSLAYRMITQWHLQKPDISLGRLTSGDDHFRYTIDPGSSDLALIKFTITNDLSGAPKLPAGKTVLGKVYNLNGPVAKDLPPGEVTIELADTPEAGSKISWYNEPQNKWVDLDTQVSGSSLKAKGQAGGIFTVFSSKK